MTANRSRGIYEESPEFWAHRGIDPEIRDARPYGRWSKDDPSIVRRAYAGLSAGQLSFIATIARQSDGWIITRHAPAEIDVDRIYPEVRPDNPVHTAQTATQHFHGDPAFLPPHHPAHLVFPLDRMAAHVARSKDLDDHHGVNVNELHEHWRLAKYVFPPGAKKRVP